MEWVIAYRTHLFINERWQSSVYTSYNTERTVADYVNVPAGSKSSTRNCQRNFSWKWNEIPRYWNTASTVYALQLLISKLDFLINMMLFCSSFVLVRPSPLPVHLYQNQILLPQPSLRLVVWMQRKRNVNVTETICANSRKSVEPAARRLCASNFPLVLDR